jgi:hypothetical protein
MESLLFIFNLIIVCGLCYRAFKIDNADIAAKKQQAKVAQQAMLNAKLQSHRMQKLATQSNDEPPTTSKQHNTISPDNTGHRVVNQRGNHLGQRPQNSAAVPSIVPGAHHGVSPEETNPRGNTGA